MKRNAMLLFFLLAGVWQVWGEYPVTLELQQVYPQSTCWDIQWAFQDDELSYLWSPFAWDPPHTLHYAFEPNGAVQEFTLPGSVYAGYNQLIGPKQIRWLRLAEMQEQPCVFVEMTNYWTIEDPDEPDYDVETRHVFMIFNLITGELIDSASVEGREEYGFSPNVYGWTDSWIPSIVPWPPLPAPASRILIAHERIGYHFSMGDEDYETYHSYIYSLVPGTWTLPLLILGNRIELFADTAQHRFAFGGRQGRDDALRQWIGVYNLQTQSVIRDSTHDSGAIPQQDRSGFRRLLAGDVALSGSTLAELWENDNLDFGYSTARPSPQFDEWIIGHNEENGQHPLFNAADGNLFDWTEPLRGQIHHVLKSLVHGDALVTTERASQEGPDTVRVYRLSVPPLPITGITCEYIADLNRVVLRWPEAPGAVAYRVWASYQAGEWGEQIARVGTTVHAVGMAPEAGVRFFHVTVEY